MFGPAVVQYYVLVCVLCVYIRILYVYAMVCAFTGWELQEDNQESGGRQPVMWRPHEAGVREGRDWEDVCQESQGVGQEMEQHHWERSVCWAQTAILIKSCTALNFFSLSLVDNNCIAIVVTYSWSHWMKYLLVFPILFLCSWVDCDWMSFASLVYCVAFSYLTQLNNNPNQHQHNTNKRNPAQAKQMKVHHHHHRARVWYNRGSVEGSADGGRAAVRTTHTCQGEPHQRSTQQHQTVAERQLSQGWYLYDDIECMEENGRRKEAI